MRKQLITLVLLGTTFFTVSAQEVTLKPIEGDFGIMLNVNGLINNLRLSNINSPINTSLITGKYYLSTEKAIRVDFGPSISSIKTMSEDSVGASLVGIDSTTTSSSLYLAVGLEKHFKGTKRLDPYIAGQVALGFIGKTKRDIEQREVTTAGTERTTVTYQQDGGFAIGLVGTAGFNYFLAKNFALGAEYSLGYNYLKQGGNYSEITQVTPISGGSTSDVEKGKLQTNSNTFNVDGTARIVLSYYF